MTDSIIQLDQELECIGEEVEAATRTERDTQKEWVEIWEPWWSEMRRARRRFLYLPLILDALNQKDG